MLGVGGGRRRGNGVGGDGVGSDGVGSVVEKWVDNGKCTVFANKRK